MNMDQVASNSRTEYVAFFVAERAYCIDIQSVREIRGWTKTTALPHAPNFVRGVFNLRGQVIPVLDLSERLGWQALEPGPRHVMIVVHIMGKTVGLLVNAVSDILDVSADELQEVPDTVPQSARFFVTAVLNQQDEMLRVLALENVLPGALEAAE